MVARQCQFRTAGYNLTVPWTDTLGGSSRVGLALAGYYIPTQYAALSYNVSLTAYSPTFLKVWVNPNPDDLLYLQFYALATTAACSSAIEMNMQRRGHGR